MIRLGKYIYIQIVQSLTSRLVPSSHVTNGDSDETARYIYTHVTYNGDSRIRPLYAHAQVVWIQMRRAQYLVK